MSSIDTVDTVKDELIHSNADFRSLWEEHQEYKRRLEQIKTRSLPSEEDEVEMKRIKLHKLTLKDKMEAMALDRLRAQPAS